MRGTHESIQDLGLGLCPNTGSNTLLDVHMLCMREMPEHVLLEKTNQEHNRACLRYLKDTDWQVLRHIRQRHLGLPTSLTEEDYTELELKRQQAADSIKKL